MESVVSLLLARIAQAHRSSGPPPSGGDPYWSNVVSLLDAQGSDGGVSFPDQGISRIWTPTSGAITSTAQHKWGSSSIYFTGTGSLDAPSTSNVAFGTGDFCVDGWIRIQDSTTNDQRVFDIGSNGISLFIGNSSTNTMGVYAPSVGIYSELYTNGPVLALDTWYFYSVYRLSGVIRAAIDGVIWGNATDAKSYPAAALHYGKYGGGGHNFKGYIGSARITEGAARYGAVNFTPPSAPFPTGP